MLGLTDNQLTTVMGLLRRVRQYPKGGRGSSIGRGSTLVKRAGGVLRCIRRIAMPRNLLPYSLSALATLALVSAFAGTALLANPLSSLDETQIKPRSDAIVVAEKRSKRNVAPTTEI